MRILAFDCSTTGCAAAVLDGDRVLARGEALPQEKSGRGQAEALMPLLDQVMREAGLDWTQLGLIGVTVGPGSFTGLRIGLSAARGFALARDIPLAGVTTAEALAEGVPADERNTRPILVAIDSKRAEPFVQLFAPDLTPVAPVAAMRVEAAVKLATAPLLVGDGAAKLVPLIPGAVLSRAPARPDPVTLARLAVRLHAEGRALPPEPLYLREADVTLPAAIS